VEYAFRVKKLLAICIFLLVPVFNTPNASGAVDLNASLNRIVIGINKFDSNSANASYATSISDIRNLFNTNASVLRELKSSIAAFKRDLNTSKRYIPSRDTKESPAFSTLMNMALGYENWLKYQNLNQINAQKCFMGSGATFNSYTTCSMRILPQTLENERLSRLKLVSALNAWKQWQIKYGYA
jgi:hypothetical protein